MVLDSRAGGVCSHRRSRPIAEILASLSMPNAGTFATTLRENEINGLALLTQVTISLRDELGIKSFYQRGVIDDLIRQLQDLSPKFHERAQRLVRLSSVRNLRRPNYRRRDPKVGGEEPSL